MIITLKIILIIIASIIGLLIIYQIVIRILRRFIHFPAPAIIGRFLDSDLRRKLQSPDAIIKRSGIKKNILWSSSAWNIDSLVKKDEKTAVIPPE